MTPIYGLDVIENPHPTWSMKPKRGDNIYCVASCCSESAIYLLQTEYHRLIKM